MKPRLDQKLKYQLLMVGVAFGFRQVRNQDSDFDSVDVVCLRRLGGIPPDPQKSDTSKSQARLLPGLTRQRGVRSEGEVSPRAWQIKIVCGFVFTHNRPFVQYAAAPPTHRRRPCPPPRGAQSGVSARQAYVAPGAGSPRGGCRRSAPLLAPGRTLRPRSH